jgi:mRNA interferase RelE/StbE
MRQITLHKSTIKFVLTLPPKQQRQIAAALIQLQQNQEPQDAKKLQEYDFYRVDCGEYRIIYDWDDIVIRVLLVGKRNDGDVYRKLQRKF